MATSNHSRRSSDGTSSSLPMTVIEPPPPHPNRLIPSSSHEATTPRASPRASPPPPPQPSSIPPSPLLNDSSSNIHLTRISSPCHLQSLPSDFLTNDPTKPLLHVDEHGNEYSYYLNPMKKAVIFILLVEMLERFSFYGINYTTTAYLTGE